MLTVSGPRASPRRGMPDMIRSAGVRTWQRRGRPPRRPGEGGRRLGSSSSALLPPWCRRPFLSSLLSIPFPRSSSPLSPFFPLAVARPLPRGASPLFLPSPPNIFPLPLPPTLRGGGSWGGGAAEPQRDLARATEEVRFVARNLESLTRKWVALRHARSRGWQGSVPEQTLQERPALDPLTTGGEPLKTRGPTHKAPLWSHRGRRAGKRGREPGSPPNHKNQPEHTHHLYHHSPDSGTWWAVFPVLRVGLFPFLLRRVRGGTWLASVLRAALRGDPSGSFGGVPHPCF